MKADELNEIAEALEVRSAEVVRESASNGLARGTMIEYSDRLSEYARQLRTLARSINTLSRTPT